jgi:hypothetical protein
MSQNVPKHFTKTFNSEIVVDCKKLVCFNDGNTRIHVAIAMTMNCIEIRPGTSSNDSHDLFYIFSRCASGGPKPTIGSVRELSTVSHYLDVDGRVYPVAIP